jgi:predicted Zn-dependent protease with MMP-like domain
MRRYEDMKREQFITVAEEVLDSLPEEFRSRIENVAILVEDFPPNQLRLRTAKAVASWHLSRRSSNEEERL